MTGVTLQLYSQSKVSMRKVGNYMNQSHNNLGPCVLFITTAPQRTCGS